MAIRTIAQVLAAVNAIRNETAPGANSRSRVSDCLQDIADTGINRDLKQVANVAALRADATLVEFGAVHLIGHTWPGIGGGDLYWDSASTTADDGGTCFAVTGVTTGRWKRRHPTGDLRDFGADPSGVASSDTAFAAALAWQEADPINRAIVVPPGDFFLEGAYTVDWHHFSLIGSSDTSRIVYAGGASADFLTFGHVWGLTIKGLWISGGAACGRHVFNLNAGGWYEFDVDVAVSGGWTSWLYSNTDGGGVLQWGNGRGSLRLSNVRQGSPVDPHHYPTNGIYVGRGYANQVSIYLDVWCASGYACYWRQWTDYIGNYGLRISGSSQGCGTGLVLDGGHGTRVVDWADESNTNPSRLIGVTGSVLENCQFPNGLVLDGTEEVELSRVSGGISQIDDCVGTLSRFSGADATDPLSRTNLSDITFGNLACFGHPGRIPAGYGFTDPPNLLLNGDMSRFVGSKIWRVVGNYSAEQCGVGCSDTTASSGAKWCARLSYTAGIPGFASFPICSSLDSSLLGCMVVYTLKYKGDSVGFTIPGLSVSAGDSIGEEAAGGYGGEVVCDDGFTLQTCARRVTQDMVDHGVTLIVHWNADEALYVSEVSGVIGYVAPRVFTRCAESPYYEGALTPNGNLVIYSAGAPVGANDPIGGAAWQDGDYAVETDPVVETSGGGQKFLTTGYRRLSSAWVPEQQLTGLVGVP